MNRRGGGQNHRRGGSRNSGNRRVGAVLSLNRVFESNGPDGKVRGTALQIYEKYMSMARDVHSLGDRILAESYLQHAEHYLRIVQHIQEQLHAQHQPAPPAVENAITQENTDRFGNYVDDVSDSEEVRPHIQQDVQPSEESAAAVPPRPSKGGQKQPRRQRQTSETDNNSDNNTVNEEKHPSTTRRTPLGLRRRRTTTTRKAVSEAESADKNVEKAPEATQSKGNSEQNSE